MVLNKVLADVYISSLLSTWLGHPELYCCGMCRSPSRIPMVKPEFQAWCCCWKRQGAWVVARSWDDNLWIRLVPFHEEIQQRSSLSTRGEVTVRRWPAADQEAHPHSHLLTGHHDAIRWLGNSQPPERGDMYLKLLSSLGVTEAGNGRELCWLG